MAHAGGGLFAPGARFAIGGQSAYLQAMPSTYAPCVPIAGKAVPARPQWLHEIKYDGYRLILVREDKRVRLLTRNGHDWSGRFPWIVESALKNRQKHFVIDGEAVVLGVDGVADFTALAPARRGSAALCLRLPRARWRRSPRPAAIDAQDQSRAAAGTPAGWHIHRAVRARRDRA